MAYIGQAPFFGNFEKIDDVSASFDGIETTFNLTSSGGTPMIIGTPYQLLVSVNGILQEPGKAFTISSSANQIILSEAPEAGSTFWAIKVGDVFNFSTVASGSITADKLSTNSVTTPAIQDGSVTTTKIVDSNVTAAKLAIDSVTNQKILNDAVTVQKIQDGAISFNKILTTDIASQAEAQAGAATNKLMTPERARESIVANRPKLFHVRDQKPAGTPGGTASSATWNIRTLNTVVTNEITGASLATNIITLPAGTYEIDALAPAYKVNGHKLRLYNITDAVTTLVGTSCHANDIVSSISLIRGRFTLTSTKTFRLEHYTTSAEGTFGLGPAGGPSEVETYADVRIEKLD